MGYHLANIALMRCEKYRLEDNQLRDCFAIQNADVSLQLQKEKRNKAIPLPAGYVYLSHTRNTNLYNFDTSLLEAVISQSQTIINMITKTRRKRVSATIHISSHFKILSDGFYSQFRQSEQRGDNAKLPFIWFGANIRDFDSSTQCIDFVAHLPTGSIF